jgi:hypothetical protein
MRKVMYLLVFIAFSSHLKLTCSRHDITEKLLVFK